MCSQNTIKNKEEIALLYMLHLVHTSVSNFAIISVSVLNFWLLAKKLNLSKSYGNSVIWGEYILYMKNY